MLSGHGGDALLSGWLRGAFLGVMLDRIWVAVDGGSPTGMKGVSGLNWMDFEWAVKEHGRNSSAWLQYLLSDP